ncbi:MAG TPA: hypothetical protein VG736_01380 [Vicinamibacterales bacterium]|jgi:hypothetical protein|nr:hypothetical protein [Vicinamibacterales bacterium]
MAADRIVLVLGMHRSGTSALTRVLNLRGAALPADLLPPNHANVAGYWEPASVVTWHDEFLTAVGSAWDDPTELPASAFETPAAEHFVDRVADLLCGELGAAPLVVMKDPRACRLVPLWRRAIGRAGREPLIALIVRHPLEVAASLQRRDGLPVSQSLLLWLEHVLAAEAFTRSDRRSIVAYDRLLDDWRGTVARIEHDLGLVPPATADVDAQVEAFLANDLRHERAERAALDDEAISDWVRRVYRWHERGSRNAALADPAELDAVRGEVHRAAALYGPVIRAQREMAARQQAELHERIEREQQQWMAERDAFASRERALQTDVAALGERLTAIEARLAAQEQTRASLQALLDRMVSTRTWRVRAWLLRQWARAAGRAR